MHCNIDLLVCCLHNNAMHCAINCYIIFWWHLCFWWLSTLISKLFFSKFCVLTDPRFSVLVIFHYERAVWSINDMPYPAHLVFIILHHVRNYFLSFHSRVITQQTDCVYFKSMFKPSDLSSQWGSLFSVK